MHYFFDCCRQILTNKYLIVPVCSMLFAQVLKVVYYSARGGKFDFMVFFSTGRMPSSHSSFVCSLATLVGFSSGFGSPLFAVVAVFSFITMYDAAGVRLQAGKQAQLLNQILDSLVEKHPVKAVHMKELLGHTPFEVYVGGVIGIIVGIIFRG